MTWEATFEHPIENSESSKRLLPGSLVIFKEDRSEIDYQHFYATVVKTGPETGDFRRLTVTVTPLSLRDFSAMYTWNPEKLSIQLSEEMVIDEIK